MHPFLKAAELLVLFQIIPLLQASNATSLPHLPEYLPSGVEEEMC